MSLLQRLPPTELVIDDITGCDQFPDDLKVYVKIWDDYHCLRRKWEGLGFCHWLFWSDNHQCQLPIPKPQTQIMDMMKSILTEVEGQGHFLVQFWKAITIEEVKRRGTKRKILTSRNQPFGFNSTNVAQSAREYMSQFYESAAISEQQHFGLSSQIFRNLRAERTPERGPYTIPLRDAAEPGAIIGGENLGLLNRVFLNWRAECTPERRVYPQHDKAVGCKITATLAFPLFEFCECAGVVEIITISDRPRNELFRDIVSKYTRDPISGKCIHLNEQNDKKEEALEEIKKSLEEVRRIHGIPFAHTWIPCKICDALVCGPMVFDSQDKPPSFSCTCQFRCLEKGQGVAGKAFLSNRLEFCEDVSGFKTLALMACFAVHLRRRSSLNEEDDIYVVEFFLPPNYLEFGDWRTTAFSLLSTMRQHLKSVTITFGGEIGKDLPFDANGGETMLQESPNQEKENDVAAHVENNNESYTEETNMTVASSLQKMQHRKAGIPVSLEVLQQQFGMKLEDAAESIGASRSTLKRACTEYKITRWPSRNKKNKENHNISKKSLQCAATEKRIDETSKAPISDPSGKQDTETNACTELHDQDTSSVTIKAKFGADFIKFKIPITSGMTEFQHQVEKRLHLKGGSYSVRYQDDDNDSILVICDEDLQDYVCYSRAMGRNTVAVSLHPITNFPNYPF